MKDEIERQGSVLVDYADLTGDKKVCEALPELTTELKEQPEMILNCLGVAIHQVHSHYSMLSSAMHHLQSVQTEIEQQCACVVSGVNYRFGEAGCRAARGRASCSCTNHQYPSH